MDGFTHGRVVVGVLQAQLAQRGRGQTVFKEDYIPGLHHNSPLRVPNSVATTLVLVPNEETHRRPVIKFPQAFFWLDNGTRRAERAEVGNIRGRAVEHLERGTSA
jgi:hypothetical protein